MPNIPVLGVIDRDDLGAVGRRALDVEVFAGLEGADRPGALGGLFEHPLFEGRALACRQRGREGGGWRGVERKERGRREGDNRRTFWLPPPWKLNPMMEVLSPPERSRAVPLIAFTSVYTWPD